MWLRINSYEKMRDGDMNVALLQSWFCAELCWCLGKTRVCSEQGKLATKGLIMGQTVSLLGSAMQDNC